MQLMDIQCCSTSVRTQLFVHMTVQPSQPCGTHLDLTYPWPSPFVHQGLQFAKEHGLVFMETSAKTAANVEEVC